MLFLDRLFGEKKPKEETEETRLTRAKQEALDRTSIKEHVSLWVKSRSWT